MTRTLSESCYLQLVPQEHWIDNQPPIGFTVKRVTQKRPKDTLPGAVVVKVNLTIDVEAFEQVPVVNVEIPLSAITPVNVEAAAASS